MNSVAQNALSFETPLEELRRRIEEMRRTTAPSPAVAALLASMQEQYQRLERQIYEDLSPWNTVEMARHPRRPQSRDYIQRICERFEELHGDRMFRDDLAIVVGLAQIGPQRAIIIGQHKGRTVEERHVCNAGCPHPEGYRKALRAMQLAERFNLPVVTLIDTKGAYPGIGSEERGVAIAIAENLRAMSMLRVPIVCVIIGEGGSGGALGIGVGDRVLMQQHAYYSVISPEGCASILWRDGNRKVDAAKVLRLTSRDLYKFGLIDEIIAEPLGGAHRDPDTAAQAVKDAVLRHLAELCGRSADELVAARYTKYRSMGVFAEGEAPPPVSEATP